MFIIYGSVRSRRIGAQRIAKAMNAYALFTVLMVLLLLLLLFNASFGASGGMGCTRGLVWRWVLLLLLGR